MIGAGWARMAGALTAVAGCLVSCGLDDGVRGPARALVLEVIDGDTVVLDSGDRVRYLMVDAPEITNGHDDCFGARAARFNADLVLGQTVELAYDVERTDRFGRLLAYVTVGGTEVNSLLVERGYACVLFIPPDGAARRDQFEGLERAARKAGRGMWDIDVCGEVPCP